MPPSQLLWPLAGAALLASCAAGPPVAAPQRIERSAPPAPRSASAAARPPAPAATGAQPPASTGLTPLPPAPAVVAAVPIGREDPFLPLGAGGVAGQPVLALPEGFRFQGVLKASGVAQALVELGSESGVLRVGDRGGRTTKLLPDGWSVAAIDVQRGQLTLRQGQQTVRAEL